MRIKLAELFEGEHAHDNDRNHLYGKIECDKVCQDWHKKLISHPLRLCDLPSGLVGQSFIKNLYDELTGFK